MKTFIHPFAFCLYPFRVTPFPYIRLRSIKFNAGTSYFSPRFAIGEAEVDGNANPALNGFVTIASRNKAPPLDRFRRGAVQRLASGAVVNLHLFRSTMIVNQHTAHLTGTVVDEYGEFPLDGRLAGDQVTIVWSVPEDGKLIDITMKGKIQGDTITGTATIGKLGEGPLTARRTAE